MIRLFDRNGDDCIDKEEFIMVWRVTPPVPTPEEEEDEDIPEDETPQESFDRWVRTQKIP